MNHKDWPIKSSPRRFCAEGESSKWLPKAHYSVMWPKGSTSSWSFMGFVKSMLSESS